LQYENYAIQKRKTFHGDAKRMTCLKCGSEKVIFCPFPCLPPNNDMVIIEWKCMDCFYEWKTISEIKYDEDGIIFTTNEKVIK